MSLVIEVTHGREKISWLLILLSLAEARRQYLEVLARCRSRILEVLVVETAVRNSHPRCSPLPRVISKRR